MKQDRKDEKNDKTYDSKALNPSYDEPLHFPPLPDGERGLLRTPSNSALRRRSEKPENAFESLSEIITKNLDQLLVKVNIKVTRGPRRSK